MPAPFFSEQLEDDDLAALLEGQAEPQTTPIPMMGPTQPIAPARAIDATPDTKDDGARPALAGNAIKIDAQQRAGVAPDVSSLFAGAANDDAELQGFRDAYAQRRTANMAADIGQAADEFTSRLLRQTPMTNFWQRQRAAADSPVETLRALAGVKAQQAEQRQRLIGAALAAQNASTAAENTRIGSQRAAASADYMAAQTQLAKDKATREARLADASSQESQSAQDRWAARNPEAATQLGPLLRTIPANQLPSLKDQESLLERAGEAKAKQEASAAAAKAKMESEEADRRLKRELAGTKTTGTTPKETPQERHERAQLKELETTESRASQIQDNLNELVGLVKDVGPTEVGTAKGDQIRRLLAIVGTHRAKFMDPSSAAMAGEVERELQNLWNPDTRGAMFLLARDRALQNIADLLRLTQKGADAEYRARGWQRPASGNVYDATRLPAQSQATQGPTAPTPTQPATQRSGIFVRHKDGTIEEVPREGLKDAIRQGATLYKPGANRS